MRLSEGIGLTDREIGREARQDSSWPQNYWETAFFIAACNTGVHVVLENYDPSRLIYIRRSGHSGCGPMFIAITATQCEREHPPMLTDHH